MSQDVLGEHLYNGDEISLEIRLPSTTVRIPRAKLREAVLDHDLRRGTHGWTYRLDAPDGEIEQHPSEAPCAAFLICEAPGGPDVLSRYTTDEHGIEWGVEPEAAGDLGGRRQSTPYSPYLEHMPEWETFPGDADHLNPET